MRTENPERSIELVGTLYVERRYTDERFTLRMDSTDVGASVASCFALEDFDRGARSIYIGPVRVLVERA